MKGSIKMPNIASRLLETGKPTSAADALRQMKCEAKENGELNFNETVTDDVLDGEPGHEVEQVAYHGYATCEGRLNHESMAHTYTSFATPGSPLPQGEPCPSRPCAHLSDR